MIKMNQVSETHPPLERIKGVKKYCGDKFMEYPLPEVVLISPGKSGGRKLLPVRTSINKNSALEENNPCVDWPQDKVNTSPSIQHYLGLNQKLVVSFQRITG